VAYSQIGIVNLALIRCKSPTISAMTENSVAARTALAVWEYVRDEVLQSFGWNFSKETAELVQDTTVPDDYDYRYAKPASCLKILSVKQEGVPIVYVERGDYIYTDVDNDAYDIIMEYVTVASDYAKWPPTFIDAFSYRLAAEMGAVLTSIDVNDMLNKYQIALTYAKGFNQGQDYVAYESGVDSWRDAGR
jgi:hypothetical protein